MVTGDRPADALTDDDGALSRKHKHAKKKNVFVHMDLDMNESMVPFTFKRRTMAACPRWRLFLEDGHLVRHKRPDCSAGPVPVSRVF